MGLPGQPAAVHGAVGRQVVDGFHLGQSRALLPAVCVVHPLRAGTGVCTACVCGLLYRMAGAAVDGARRRIAGAVMSGRASSRPKPHSSTARRGMQSAEHPLSLAGHQQRMHDDACCRLSLRLAIG